MTKCKTKFGRIYKKWNTARDGSRVEHTTWTVRYKGKDYATGETDPKLAEKFLFKLASDIAHRPKDLLTDRQRIVLIAELLDGVIENYRRKENRTLQGAINAIEKHLRPAFGAMPATALSTAAIDQYVRMRRADKGHGKLADGAPKKTANATINRELTMLKRGFRLGYINDPPKVQRVPHIALLPENNVRKGFVVAEQYEALKREVPEHLRLLVTCGYHTGCRRTELLNLKLSDIEIDAEPPQFRLWAGETKNGSGRVIPIYGDMLKEMREHIEKTKLLYPRCEILFHKNGQRFKHFVQSWATARNRAKLPGLLFHDLRRSAVRNLTRAGVSRPVAKQISGHKSDAVFYRYDITDISDLRDAAAKMNSFAEKERVRV